MSTNWPDVAALIVCGATFCGALGLGGWLVVEGHPWFALLVFIIAGSMRMVTGDKS
jgi:hypothetical protein